MSCSSGQARLSNVISVGGSTVVRETRGSMAAYFAQLPGCRDRYRCRPGAISSRNLSHFVSLEGYPAGDPEGYWGAPVMQFLTNGGTVHNWHPHVGEVGHTAVFGMTGSGKTVLLSMLQCALQRTFQPTDTIIVFDKDRGMQTAVMANGGPYVALRRGTASGSAPLRVYDNTPRTVSHLAALFKRLITLDGRGEIEPVEDDMLHRGVACSWPCRSTCAACWGSRPSSAHHRPARALASLSGAVVGPTAGCSTMTRTGSASTVTSAWPASTSPICCPAKSVPTMAAPPPWPLT